MPDDKRLQRLENQVKALAMALRLTLTVMVKFLSRFGEDELTKRLEAHLQALASIK